MGEADEEPDEVEQQLHRCAAHAELHQQVVDQVMQPLRIRQHGKQGAAAFRRQDKG